MSAKLHPKSKDIPIKENKTIEINCPKLIQKYNQHMGGADRQDQNMNKYRIGFRGKKWYWCIFTWLVDVTVQNPWLLHKKSGGTMIHRVFKEELAQIYLARYGVPPKKAMSLSMCSSGGRKRVSDELQYDGVEHYLVETPEKTRRRCAGENCAKRVASQCSKCNVGLCLRCNLSYHKK